MVLPPFKSTETDDDTIFIFFYRSFGKGIRLALVYEMFFKITALLRLLI